MATWVYTWVVANRGVAEDQLDMADIGTVSQQVGGAGVAQRMRADRRFDTGSLDMLPNETVDRFRSETSTRA